MKEESTKTEQRNKIGKKILISPKRTGITHKLIWAILPCERTREATPKQKKNYQKTQSDEEVMTILRSDHLSVPFRKHGKNFSGYYKGGRLVEKLPE